MARKKMKRGCGAMATHRNLVQTEPVYVENRRAIEGYTLGRMARARATSTRTVVTIPVVVHVVYKNAADNISEAQIQSQIDALNADYRKRNADISKVPAPFRALAADAKIEFRLAARDQTGSPTNGITRTKSTKSVFTAAKEDIKRRHTGGHTAWPRDQYLNIWVCPKIVDPAVGELLGYAQFPGGPAATDGVVIATSAFGTKGRARAPFNRGRTATHEIGHWLNLLHIWGDDDGGCSGSDSVSDTPNQSGPSSGLPKFPRVSCNNKPHGDMFMNYMDYTDDPGMFMFTKGQVARMRTTLTGPRASLADSPALEPVARVPRVSLPKVRKASVDKAIGRELGTEVTKIFDGNAWVPRKRALATLRSSGKTGRKPRGR
jgi:hypothetical protein